MAPMGLSPNFEVPSAPACDWTHLSVTLPGFPGASRLVDDLCLRGWDGPRATGVLDLDAHWTANRVPVEKCCRDVAWCGTHGGAVATSLLLAFRSDAVA